MIYNNINFSQNQIKNLIYKLREETYPNDMNYLYDISKITISFSKNNKDYQNLPFCYTNQFILNEKNKKQESFILFTSKIQLNKIKDCVGLFMDGTFHSSPKNYYQLYNIIGKEKKQVLLFL